MDDDQLGNATITRKKAAEEDDFASDEWPSDHHPGAGKSTMKQPPADWHHRDRGGKWTA
jgi:hypothetical protein